MSKKFVVTEAVLSKNIIYYIYFLDDYNSQVTDVDIAEFLDMTLEQYQELAKKFNAIYDHGMSFKTRQEAQNFADYINNKYILILKLAGKL